jgi:hypothetical protein
VALAHAVVAVDVVSTFAVVRKSLVAQKLAIIQTILNFYLCKRVFDTYIK